MRRRTSFKNFCLFVFSLMFVAGCNQTFEPLQENNQYFFSIFGYLDASALADTQWVRIVPPRGELNAPPEIPEMTVTLENLETLTSVTMKDSLFGEGSEFNYINFFTLADIEPDQTYRIKAEHPDGRTSQAILTNPKEFPTPLFLSGSSIGSEERIHTVVVPGTKDQKLVDVQTWWFVRNNETNQIRKFTFSHRYSARWIDSFYGGAYIVDVRQDREEGTIFGTLNISSFFSSSTYDLLRRQIFVAVGGPEWNEEIPDMSDLVYAQMEDFSNVENGLGYMIGVYSKIIPYYTCKTEDESNIKPCEVEKPFR